MKVIIAEKPSVARNIAEAIGARTRKDGYLEGAEYLVTWAFGHLLELLDAKEYNPSMASWRIENYPFIPETFNYRVKNDSQNKGKIDEGANKQIALISTLIGRDDVDGVISATDYDREGQIIGDIILEFLQVKKPIQRLLLNEWTAEEVRSGLEKLVPNEEMHPLRDAGISRQWTDWLIGINLTSVATLKYQRGGGKALNIGRVLLPTLKIIYDRDMEIEKFIPEEFHKLTGHFKSSGGITYDGVFQVDGVERFTEKGPLESLMTALKEAVGTVTVRTIEEKREYPQPLFNLSNLQGHVTSKEKGWTSEKVLKVAQSLYEKKFITYPRTASIALEESLIQKTARVLDSVKKGLPYEKDIKFNTSKRVFDNSKVESHSAIIPTYVIPNGLSHDEQVVYDAVKNRFIMQFMPVAVHEEGTLITNFDIPEATLDEVQGHFVTKSRVQKIMGWKLVEKVQTKDKELPEVMEGETCNVTKTALDTKGTNPPKRHTEKTLLKVMETCGKRMKKSQAESIKESLANDGDGDEDSEGEGMDSDGMSNEIIDDEMMKAILSGFSIGTPATRAETISKLKSIGYITTKGKTLQCTVVGKNMVEMFPIKELLDLDYTGRLEKTLADIGKGALTKDGFMDHIKSFVVNSVEIIKKDDFHIISNLENGHSRNYKGASMTSGRPASQSEMQEGADDHVQREVLGKCPGCGSDVIEGEKGFGCTNWKGGCKFVIWKDDKFLASLKAKATKQTVMKLLETGSVRGNGFVSKKGNRFSATLTYVKDPETGYYNWKMSFD